MNNGHNSADLERQVEAQRHRVESTLDEIKERLSPGQLLDEVLSYAGDGGKAFASSLGSTVTQKPLPTALLGISLAWLMFGPGQDAAARDSRHKQPSRSYGRVGGEGLQRIAHTQDDIGDWYSAFIDDTGRKYRARSNAMGERAGHFIDEAGATVHGFMDDAGHRVDSFRDEAGNLLDSSLGWAAQTWDDAVAGVSHVVDNVSESAADMAQSMRDQARHATDSAIRAFESQPLVAGALAFAAGAALGGVLPSTREEDAVVGRYADDVKREAAHVAGDLYEQGKHEAAKLYDDASEKVGEVYSDAKRRVAGEDDEQRPRPH